MAALLAAAGRVSAEETPRHFQLVLPEFNETPFEDGQEVIELPDRPIRRMDIVVLDAQQRGISQGAVKVWVNGKGVGNILEGRNVAAGTCLSMNPQTLRMRPDEIFDPRENTIEVSASDRRGRRFYQNWIVRVAADRYSSFAYSGNTSPDDPKGAPPDILLDLPSDPPVIPPGKASAGVLIKGTCASAEPGAMLTANGKTISPYSAPATFPFEIEVEAQRTAPEIVLEAVDRKGNRRRVVIPVVAQQGAPSKARFAGKKYALVIGISRYGDANDAPPALYAAAADAAEFGKQLLTKGGFRPENLRVLTDEKATMEQIRVGFYDFAAKADRDDLLLIYVIAYGLHDPRPGRAETLYLAAHGTRVEQLESTALAFEELDRLLNRSLRSNNAFLVFDVGHELPAEWKFPGRSLVNNRLLNIFSEQLGRAVLVSGSSGEVSRSREAGGPRLFHQWLTAGLSGKADLNLDRVVSAAELFGFVTGQVQKETSNSQTPRFRLSTGKATVPVID